MLHTDLIIPEPNETNNSKVVNENKSDNEDNTNKKQLTLQEKIPIRNNIVTKSGKDTRSFKKTLTILDNKPEQAKKKVSNLKISIDKKSVLKK